MSLAPVPPEFLSAASLCFIWYFSMGNYRPLGLDKFCTLQIIWQSATYAVNRVCLVTMTAPNAPHISNQLHKNIKFSESKHGRNQLRVILSAAMVILRIAKNARNSKQVLLICFLLSIVWETEKTKHNHNGYLISD